MSMLHRVWLWALLGCVCCPQHSNAQSVTCERGSFTGVNRLCDVGEIAGGTSSEARSISANGERIVGLGMVEGRPRGYVWSEKKGFHLLESGSGGEFAETRLLGISSDGTTGVGQIVFDAASTGVGVDPTRAVRWEIDGNSVEVLNRPNSIATAVNSDGSVVVGSFVNENGFFRAFRWIGSQTDELPTLPDPNLLGGLSVPLDISDDGQVIVGYVNGFLGDGNKAVRWVGQPNTALSVERLPALSNEVSSVANGVNMDGTLTVGFSETPAGQQAVVWKSSDIQELIGLQEGEDNQALDLSSDGNTIVGFSNTSSGRRAVLWKDNSPANNLATLSGHNASEANAVSEDGSVVTGTSCVSRVGLGCRNNPSARAFVLRITSEGPQPVQDLSNLVISGQRAVLERSLSIAAAQQPALSFFSRELSTTSAIEDVPENSVRPHGDPAFGYAPRKLSMRVDFDHARWHRGHRMTFTSAAIAGEVGRRLTLGANFEFGNLENTIGDLYYSGRFSQTSIYLRKRPYDNSGVTWKIGVGYGESDMETVRQAKHTDIESGVGDTRIKARAIFSELGYHHKISDVMSATPYIGLTKVESKSPSYTEKNNISFPISYSEYSQRVTQMTIGVKLRLRLSRSLRLNFDMGIDSDLRRSATASVASSFGNLIFSSPAPTVLNSERLFTSLRLSRQIGRNHAIQFNINSGQSAYTNTFYTSAGVGYVARF